MCVCVCRIRNFEKKITTGPLTVFQQLFLLRLIVSRAIPTRRQRLVKTLAFVVFRVHVHVGPRVRDSLISPFTGGN